MKSTHSILDHYRYNIPLDNHYDDILGTHSKKPWKKFVTPQNEHLVSDEALDLLSQMLKYDHAERILPKEALDHPYFKPIKEFHAKKAAEATKS